MKTLNTLCIILIYASLTACKSGKKEGESTESSSISGSMANSDKTEHMSGNAAKLVNGITGEALDLEEQVVTEGDAQDLVDDGPDYIKFETGGAYRSVPAPVNTSYIDKDDWLFLNTQATTLCNANGNPCGSSIINAVRITMGVDLTVATAPKTKLFFEPLYLCRTTNKPGEKDDYTVTANAVAGIFEFDGTNFVPSAFGNYVTNYRTTIEINCFASPSYRGFIDSGDSDGDTKSGIYPIQEFIDLIDHNESTQGVYILNTGYRTGSLFDTYTRHGLLFCPNNFTFMEQFDLSEPFIKDNAIGTFTGKLADKGGLCPPDCDKVYYKRR